MNNEIVWLEDEKSLMDNNENLFIANGLTILKCTTSTQAFKQIIEGDKKNILLDLEFPNSIRDGLLFLEQISKFKKDLNVVILTGKPNLKEALRLVNEGVVKDYLEKPIPDDESGREIFFHTLKKHFQFYKENCVREDNVNILRKWRWNTWIQLIGMFLLTLFVVLLILGNNDWNLTQTYTKIKDNIWFSGLLGIIWFLTNTFLIRNLYDKYNNYSNISNYIKKVNENSY
jgi:FixJ family two-component response regulator